VQIVDVRDPARPTLLGRYETPSRAMDVQVVENTAYLATEYSGVYVLDVHNPAAPRLRTHYDVEGAYTVQLVGDRLYVAANGLQIIMAQRIWTATRAVIV
jgi:hypothetical protein